MEDKKSKRFTIQGSNMPKEFYDVLKEKSEARAITPYIISLMEKEKLMNQLIQLLPNLTLLTGMNKMLEDIHNGSIQVAIPKDVDEVKEEVAVSVEEEDQEELEDALEEVIPEGDIKISNVISGGFEEDDYDF